MNNAIEVKNITKRYSDFVLDDISFSLPSGTILGLVGENGAGKSTTINIIMNAIKRDSGSVFVLGTDNQSSDFKNTKEDIGVVLDESYFPEVITPRNVNLMMQNTYKNWDEALFYEYLTKFKLPESKQFKDFSRGMKMKLAIAVALSHHPKLLVLDEATSGLDPMIRDEILDIFNEFTRDETNSILLSSHIVSDLEKICDYIAFIHQGKLLFCDEKDRLLEKYAIIKMSATDFEKVPKKAIISKKQGAFGVKALVDNSYLSSTLLTERTSLEDIILFYAKEEDRK